MPTQERIQQFVSLVEAGDTVQALREFYTEDAIQQENQARPRSGRETLIQHEQKMLAAFDEIKFQVAGLLVDGDQVAINYVFSGSTRGQRIRQDELALQRWVGDQIVEERFYYDPGQSKPAKNTGRPSA